LDETTYTYQYLPHRGLTNATLSFYDIKTKVDPTGRPIADGFIYPNGDTKVRQFDRKEFLWRKVDKPVSPDQLDDRSKGPGLFGRDKFNAGGHKSIILTEGEYDAASCYQVLHVPAVSVCSSSSASRDVIVDRSFVDSHERIYLAFDNDPPGREALKAVARLFDYNKILVLDFDRRKDANEFLQNGDGDELRNIFANAKKYLPETVVSINASSIATILAEKPSVGIPYPFPKLSEMTFGMRTGESVLITAPSGVGKTEFMHALEFQLLKETTDAIGAIFLEEPKADHLRTLASIQLQRPVFHPDDGVSLDETTQAVQEACGTDDRLHLYSHFGSDDPDILLDTIRFLVTACSCRWVLLDHISLVVSGIRGESDERRALDYIITRLEMMVKELNFGLILVSHINDNGQTRGSRAIHQLVDIRIDLTRDIESNIVDIFVSKARPPMCKTGKAGSYVFDPFSRKYTQVANDNDTPAFDAFSAA
jgi:twinkle protein